jgi:hypothetical protein
MLRSRFALLSVLVLPLVAASAPGDFGSLREFAGAVRMKPGAWQTRITITEAKFKPSPTAAPAELAKIRADMEARLGKADQRNECLDPGSENGLRLPGIVIDPSCSFSRLHAAGGRWTLDSTCSEPDKREFATMKGEGTYSRRAVAGRHEGEASFKGAVLDIRVEFESRHVGKCPSLRPFDVTAEDD